MPLPTIPRKDMNEIAVKVAQISEGAAASASNKSYDPDHVAGEVGLHANNVLTCLLNFNEGLTNQDPGTVFHSIDALQKAIKRIALGNEQNNSQLQSIVLKANTLVKHIQMDPRFVNFERNDILEGMLEESNDQIIYLKIQSEISRFIQNARDSLEKEINKATNSKPLFSSFSKLFSKKNKVAPQEITELETPRLSAYQAINSLLNDITDSQKFCFDSTELINNAVSSSNSLSACEKKLIADAKTHKRDFSNLINIVTSLEEKLKFIGSTVLDANKEIAKEVRHAVQTSSDETMAEFNTTSLGEHIQNLKEQNNFYQSQDYKDGNYDKLALSRINSKVESSAEHLSSAETAKLKNFYINDHKTDITILIWMLPKESFNSFIDNLESDLKAIEQKFQPADTPSQTSSPKKAW